MSDTNQMITFEEIVDSPLWAKIKELEGLDGSKTKLIEGRLKQTLEALKSGDYSQVSLNVCYEFLKGFQELSEKVKSNLVEQESLTNVIQFPCQ